MDHWAWLVIAALICWIIATVESVTGKPGWRLWIPLGLVFVALWMLLEVA